MSDGQTALGPDDRDGLKLTYVATRAELNAAEQRSIARALLHRRTPSVAQVLDDRYLRDLHRDLFGRVWSWAGTYRVRDTNIGVPWEQVSSAVRQLVDDARVWLDGCTDPVDELVVRFHHRLVWIHPFPNGNGRHGRIAADELIAALGADPFSWGRGLPDPRAAYLDALRCADRGDAGPLYAFARA